MRFAGSSRTRADQEVSATHVPTLCVGTCVATLCVASRQEVSAGGLCLVGSGPALLLKYELPFTTLIVGEMHTIFRSKPPPTHTGTKNRPGCAPRPVPLTFPLPVPGSVLSTRDQGCR